MDTSDLTVALIGAAGTIIAAFVPLIFRKLHIERPKWLTWRSTAAFFLNVLWVAAIIFIAGKIAGLLIPTKIALKDHDDRFVTALNAASSWAIKASSDSPAACSYFSLVHQNGSRDLVALRTCYGRYITAMDSQQNWNLVAEAKIVGDWEKFAIIDLGNNQIALRTFHSRYVTAMNNQPGWDWELRGETQKLSTWETFEKVSQPWISMYLAVALASAEVAVWYLIAAVKRKKSGNRYRSNHRPPNTGSRRERLRR